MRWTWEVNSMRHLLLHRASSRSLPRSSRNQITQRPIIDFSARQWFHLSIWTIARMPQAQMINYLKHRLNRIRWLRHHSLQDIQLDRPTSKHSALINLIKTINSHQQHETDLEEKIIRWNKVKTRILLTSLNLRLANNQNYKKSFVSWIAPTKQLKIPAQVLFSSSFRHHSNKI